MVFLITKEEFRRGSRKASSEAGEALFRLVLAFPELAFQAFYVAHADPEPPDPSDSEKARVFGIHRIGDLPKGPEPLGKRELLRILQRLARGWRLLGKEGLGQCLGFWGCTRRIPLVPDPAEPYSLALLGRLRPIQAVLGRRTR